jgi:isopentenyl diphosphate isomerase/L-lactate dehydrogenase-like FMN-dependent dehydrogenase
MAGLMSSTDAPFHATLDILNAELRRAMSLLVAPGIADLTTAHVRLRDW